MELGERIEKLRWKCGLSAGKLAEKAGVNPCQLSRIIHGHVKNPTAPTLSRIAEALGTTVGYLLGHESARENPGVKESKESVVHMDSLRMAKEVERKFWLYTFAGQALAGYNANPDPEFDTSRNGKVRGAVEDARALLAELEKGESDGKDE